MAPRVASRKARENDYSNVGKAGRRTGVTLAEGRRDEHGLEEITGIFSSPHKPSPAPETPAASLQKIAVTSTRRSIRAPSLPRSASPRKSGISGSARRGTGVDLSPYKQPVQERENTPPPTYPTPIPINGYAMRRFSPEKSPLKEIASNRSTPPRSRSTRKGKNKAIDEGPIAYSPATNRGITSDNIDPSLQETDLQYDDNVVGVNDEDDFDDYLPEHENVRRSVEHVDLDAQLQSDAQQNDEPSSPAKARGGRKRKSDDVEEAASAQRQRTASTQPNTKRARTASTKKQKAKENTIPRDESVARHESVEGDEPYEPEEPEEPEEPDEPDEPEEPATQAIQVKKKKKGRAVGAPKDPNLPMSKRQQKEVEEYVERIKARPGKTKSLYILRRETPTDESVTHTRSGRVSVKPLAYWRNERCVYGNEGGIPEGSRFPLSTIKEVIRTEEVDVATKGKGKSGAKKRNGKCGSSKQGPSEDDGGDTDDAADDDAEPWEVEDGTLRGPVLEWDQDVQAASEETNDSFDIAYSSLAIQTREVRNASFRYAKLISTPFFGTGIVDIPPGGEKRPKNSRKMHMCFYVFEGRVNVEVASNQFSVGRGGMWQVPRGNLYSISNKLEKPARIFFSQGCVTSLDDDVIGGAAD